MLRGSGMMLLQMNDSTWLFYFVVAVIDTYDIVFACSNLQISNPMNDNGIQTITVN